MPVESSVIITLLGFFTTFTVSVVDGAATTAMGAMANVASTSRVLFILLTFICY